MELPWSQEVLGRDREELSKIALTESEPVIADYYDHVANLPVPFAGEDFSGSLWVSGSEFAPLVGVDGSIDILNEGVFVGTEPSKDWLPPALVFCSGVINFSSKAVTLPAARDKVIKDERFRIRKEQIAELSFGIIDVFCRETRREPASRKFAALVLAYMFKKAPAAWRVRLLRRIDDYEVQKFKRTERLRLGDIRHPRFSTVHLGYETGKWVTELGTFDGKKLWHQEDEFVQLQCSLLSQDDELVLWAVRDDTEEAGEKQHGIREADMLQAYFKLVGINVIDLTSKNVIEGKQRSKGVPGVVRQHIKNSVKFVEIRGLPNKLCWKVGSELWLNLSHPFAKVVYESFHEERDNTDKLRLATVLFHLLSYEFDEALQALVGMFE